MSALLLTLSFWLGGSCCAFGFFLAGVSRNPQTRLLTLSEKVYAFLACLFWPLSIVQYMAIGDE